MDLNLEKLTDLSEQIDKRIKNYQGTQKRIKHTGYVYYYCLEPNNCKYEFIITPINQEIAKALKVNETYDLVTLIMPDSMRSFPVDLSNIRHPEYLKDKLKLNDQYLHKILYVLLRYIGDDINTELNITQNTQEVSNV